MGTSSVFWYFLVHNFHKDQYFQKAISFSIYIFQGGSFDVSNIKIYFFQIFFIQGSPLWFWKTLIGNEKSTISVRKKIKTDLKSVGKTLSFAPCNDEFFFGNHPNVHISCILHEILKPSQKYICRVVIQLSSGKRVNPYITGRVNALTYTA